MPVEWVIPAVALLLVIAITVIRSRIKALHGEAGAAWSELDAALQQRHKLIERLVEIVQRLAPRQKRLLDRVVAARKKATAQPSPAPIGRAEMTLSAEVAKLLEPCEADPEVTADARFRRVRSELQDSERLIAQAQERFNAAARANNQAIRSFPAALLHALIQFEAVEYYGGPDTPVHEGSSRAADHSAGF